MTMTGYDSEEQIYFFYRVFLAKTPTSCNDTVI